MAKKDKPPAKQQALPRTTVVGIGASAGGIEALRAFFDAVPADLGIAFVVVVHLAPNRESELASILGQWTPMSVVQVSDDQKAELKPNCVYVISPDRKLEITDSSIGASHFDTPSDRRAAIDVFFRSLAANYGDGYAVILSGGSSDGALGAKAVKESGGVILVQDPREAGHDAMPRAVIAAQVADIVLPVRELAGRLAELTRHKAQIAGLIQPAFEPGVAPQAEPVLTRILDLLRARTGHDFTRYKRPTILRRLASRMQLNSIVDLEDYLNYLRDHPDEVQSLFDALLISVTSFFRDRDAWEALRSKVIVPIVERTQPGETIRAWAPGCATGEETYSIAMLFREEISRRDLPCELVVFGSDVDQRSLNMAREGVYPSGITADIPAERLARFFRPDGDHYRVTSEIRDCVVFAAHSVLRDPPFSKLNLISCRNLLIYLDRGLQRQLQHVFHYGLREDGFLFIGISESVDLELFDPVDQPNRIFRSRGRQQLPVARFPQIPPTPRHQPDPAYSRGQDGPRRAPGEIQLEMLEAFAPPSVLVDQHWNVAHLSPNAGRYLQPRGGPPDEGITQLVRTELLEEVRAVLNHAFELNEGSLSQFVPVGFNGTSRLVAVLAQPRPPEPDGRRVLLSFLEGGKAREDGNTERSQTDTMLDSFREKLRVAEQRVETMRQEHSVAYEDLRAANEELQSLNEEYRSTTEELETSKEELQSVNEELQTVNDELKMKLEEVSRSNNDLENFITAADLPMLFLDRSLCIKRFTPTLAEFFNVKPLDTGRPIGDLTQNLGYDELEKDAEQVLHSLVPFERKVARRDGDPVLVRIRPYRTAEDRIEGVVMTVVR